MKTINTYINEKLVIGNNLKGYNYYPNTNKELREILEERLAKDKNADLNDIDVSNITDMSILNGKGLFERLDPHNIDISEWDVSNVTDMSYMFNNCSGFNADLSKWDVSNVTDMRFMFTNCYKFNSDVSNWDVSKVIITSAMFFNCIEFNSDMSKWDVSNITHMDDMFSFCTSFEGKGLEKWNVAKVKYGLNMLGMFDSCVSLKNTPTWYKG